MPFDATLVEQARLRTTRPVAYWLFGICAMLLVMIVLGGVTRLTGSGLSIMEWAPLSGALPPLSEAEWRRLFALYQQIPQYALVNEGFGIEGFKHIFWLEWAHRLWGRLIGLAFAGPLVWFVWRRAIPRALVPRLALLFALGGLQGAVGWFMVASGFFPDSTAVAPARLVVHLALALTLYSAILWTGLFLLRPEPVAWAPGRVRALARLAAGLAGLTILAGGFVAGTHAGLTYNTFPLMDGRLVPEGYAMLHPFWRNLFENIPAVQFDHRALATLTAVAALAAVWAGRASPARRPLLALGAAVVVQYSLGVATLLHAVPVPLAAAHQAVAVLVLTAAIVSLHALRRPGSEAP
jgi:cytochrome c oxidase assembly protein subunit 15